MLLCASREGRRRSILPTHKTPRSSNTARGPWPVFPESSRSGRRTDCRRWSRPLGVCRPCPARVRRLRGFACAICECDRGPSVVLDLCVITRGERVRYYLAIGVSSAGARAVVVGGRGSGAASSCGGECAHGCNGKAAAALVSRLPQRRRAVVAGRCARSLYARGRSDARRKDRL